MNLQAQALDEDDSGWDFVDRILYLSESGIRFPKALMVVYSPVDKTLKWGKYR